MHPLLEFFKCFVMSAVCECNSFSLLKMPTEIKAQTIHNILFDLKCFIYLFALFTDLFEPDLTLFSHSSTTETKINMCTSLYINSWREQCSEVLCFVELLQWHQQLLV